LPNFTCGYPPSVLLVLRKRKAEAHDVTAFDLSLHALDVDRRATSYAASHASTFTLSLSTTDLRAVAVALYD
jgi:hypothetical protein